MAILPYGFGNSMGLGFQIPRAANRAMPEPELTEEEERGLLARTMGFLQYAGETLDKPGAAVRGVLAGKPDALLNLIPFSDTLGWTDPSERVQGRDLLETWGLAPKNIPGFWSTGPEDTFFDVAGFAAEVALDPLTWVSGPGKAITKAGQLAEKGTVAGMKGLSKKATAKASVELSNDFTKSLKLFKESGQEGAEQLGRTLGRTPTEKADEIRQGLRGVMGIGLPWGKPKWVIGAGSEKAARATEMFYGNPVATAIRSVFSPTVGGLYDSAAQKAKDLQVAKLGRLRDDFVSVVPAFRARGDDMRETLTGIMRHHAGMDDAQAVQAFKDLTRQVAEMPRPDTRTVDAVGKMIDTSLGRGANTTEWKAMADNVSGKFHEYIEGMMVTKDRVFNEARELGLNIEELDDMYIGHAMRHPSNPKALRLAKQQQEQNHARLFGTGTPNASPRNNVLRHVPGGTQTLTEITRNKTIMGVEKVGDEWVRLAPNEHKQLLQGLLEVSDDTLSLEELQAEAIRRSFIEPRMNAAREKGTFVDRAKAEMIAQNERAMKGGRTSEVVDLTDDNIAIVSEGIFKREMDSWSVGFDSFVHQTDDITGVGDEVLLSGKVKGVLPDIKPRAEELAAYLNKLPANIVEGGLFDRLMIDDWHDYMEHMFVAMSTMHSAHAFVRGKDVVRLAGEGEQFLDPVSLKQAWNDAKLNDRGFTKLVKDHAKENKVQLADADAFKEYAERMTIDSRSAKTLKAYVESMQPKVTNTLLELGDKVTALYKGALTTPFPAFHTRNLTAGIWASWAEGDIKIQELIPEIINAARHWIKPGSVDSQFYEEFARGGGLGSKMSQMVDVVGEKATGPGGIPSLGKQWADLTDATKWRKGSRWANVDPIAMRGVRPHMVKEGGEAVLDASGNPKMQENVWSTIGGYGYETVEYLNRAPYYAALRKKGFTPAQAMHKVKLSQFDYGELAPFEKTVARRLVPFYCVPVDCEILTRTGWKTYDHLKVGEEVMGYDVESHTQQWTTVEDVATFDYSDTMYIIREEDGAEWMSTPDHRWPILRDDERTVVRSYQLRVDDAIPRTARLAGWPKDCPFSVLDATIIGWLAVGGHIRGDVWTICQDAGDLAHVIRDTVGDDLLTEDADAATFTIRESYVTKLRDRGFRSLNDLSAVIGTFNEENANAMLDALYQAGKVIRNTGSDFLAVTRPQVRDGMQMLIQMLGKYMRLSEYGGHITCGEWYRQSMEGTSGCRHYKGKIWCPKTGTGTWVMRRNGNVIITGNTWSRKNVPYTISKILNRPGGRTAQTVRALNQGSEGSDYTPRFLREGVAVRVGGEERKAGFIKGFGLPVEDLNKFIMENGLPSARTAEKMMAMTHPVGVAGYEFLSGRNLYFGRDIKNMEGISGNKALDFMLMKSPLSRFGNEFWGLTDDRKSAGQKAVNVLTGLKFGTYDLPKHRALELADILEGQLEDNPAIKDFTKQYVPADKMAKLPPEEQEVLRTKLKKVKGLRAIVSQLRKATEEEEKKQASR